MSEYPNQQERIAGMARNVVAGHRGAFGQPCSECGQLSPCHAWTLANEILHPLHSNPTSSVSTEGVADLREAAIEAFRADGIAAAQKVWPKGVALVARLAINPDSPVEPDRG